MPRVALLLFVFGFAFTARCANASERSGYVGDAACAACHQDQADAYRHTVHHLTSQPGNQQSILGSFAPGSNVLMIADPATARWKRVRMALTKRRLPGRRVT